MEIAGVKAWSTKKGPVGRTPLLDRLHPYVYFVDVLQRLDHHPAREVEWLTPRLWKERFAADPLQSAIDRVVKNAVP